MAKIEKANELPLDDNKTTTIPTHSPVSVATYPTVSVPEVSIKRGQALVVKLDEKGNEIGDPFTTNILTAETYYKEPHFRIKKK